MLHELQLQKTVYITDVGLHCIFFFSFLFFTVQSTSFAAPASLPAWSGATPPPWPPALGFITSLYLWLVHADAVQSAQPHVGKLYQNLLNFWHLQYVYFFKNNIKYFLFWIIILCTIFVVILVNISDLFKDSQTSKWLNIMKDDQLHTEIWRQLRHMWNTCAWTLMDKDILSAISNLLTLVVWIYTV